MKYLTLLLLFYFLPISANPELPDLRLIGKPQTKQDLQINPVAVPPDPAALQADWWRYFDTAPADLPQRLDNLIQHLQASLQAMPENLQAETKARIGHMRANWQAQLELRKKTSQVAPVLTPIRTSYTLKQWLDIIHQRRTVQAELQSAKEDLTSEENHLNIAQQRLDSMTAAYLSLQGQTSNKTAQGIALIATWSEHSLGSERFRLQQEAFALQQQLLEHLVEESTAAQNRLLISAADLQQLKEELATAKRELDSARKSTMQLTASRTIDIQETDEDKLQALLFEQQARHSAIKEAIADTILTRKYLELQLAEILTVPDSAELNQFRTQLQEHLDHIETISSKQKAWRGNAERDQGRAGKSLAALFTAATKQSGEVIKLTQRRLDEVQKLLLALQRLDSEIQDIRLIADKIKTLVAVKDGSLRNGLETVKTSSTKAWELVWDRLGISLFKIGETPVTILGILRVLFIFLLAWLLSHFVRRGLKHLTERQRGSSSFLYTLGRLAHYLILTIGISIGLSSIGIDLSNFALIAGALSLGIGFGLQTIVSNFVSGLIVLFERSLRIGDFVELSSGLAGEVRAINVRSTLVTTTDMVDILVPNSEFVNGKVINWTLTDASRRIHIPFGVAYGSDKELVRKAGLEAAQQTPHTLKDRSGREPEVWLTNFGDSSLDFELVVWVLPHAVKKPQRARAAYYWELETALRKYGVEIPFPQRDLHIRSGFEQLSSENKNHVSETQKEFGG